MKYWERFRSHKERGEWAELQFMAEAAKRRFTVCKPWGETRPYDVGIEYGQSFLRVQVKSTTQRQGAGYRCEFKANFQNKHDYSLKQIDVFAALVIPEETWYLIPASLILGSHRVKDVAIYPLERPRKRASYRFECFREAWGTLTKSRSELGRYGL